MIFLPEWENQNEIIHEKPCDGDNFNIGVFTTGIS